MSMFFKETDRNGFIDVKSCHFAWLKSVSKSYFYRLKRNCINRDDFHREAGHLRKRFLDKGYCTNDLDEAFVAVHNKNTEDMVQPKLAVETGTHSNVNHAFLSPPHNILPLRGSCRNIGEFLKITMFWASCCRGSQQLYIEGFLLWG